MQYAFHGYRHSGGSPEGAMTEPLSEAEVAAKAQQLADKISGILFGVARCTVEGYVLTITAMDGGELEDRHADIARKIVDDFGGKLGLEY